MLNLQSPYNLSPDQKSAVTAIINNFQEQKEQVLLGVTGSGKTFVMANVIQQLNKPTLVLSHNKTLAAQLFEEFRNFFPNNAVKYFVSYYDYYQPEAYIPSRDVYIEKESQINKEIEKFRLSAMNAIITRKDVIVVASVSAIYNIGDPHNYQNKSLVLSVNQEISLSSLLQRLVFMQYHRDSYDFEEGAVRVKGDIIDIYPPYSETAIRLSLFGDIIEQISIIDPLTNRIINKVNETEIFPAKNFIFEKDIIKNAVEKIEKDLNKRVTFLQKIGKELEAHRLKQRTMYDIEMLLEVGYCKGMENYSIYFENRPPGSPPYTLMDYFPKDYLLLIDESHITIPQIGGMFNGDRSRKETLVEHGFRLPSALDNRPLNFEEFRERQGRTLYVSATPGDWEMEVSHNTVVELLTRPTGLLDPKVEIYPAKFQVDKAVEEIQKTVAKHERVLVTTLTKRMAEDLTDYLKDLDIKVAYIHSDIDTIERVEILNDLREGKYDVLVGINLLREGLDLPEVSLVVILDADKEGFLRSRRSLIQIMGRAARHVNGRVLLFADNMTNSIKDAVDETTRRRAYQEAYNKKYNITPKSIHTSLTKSILTAQKAEANNKPSGDISAEDLSEDAIKKLITRLQTKMEIAAQNLQFEKAAQFRDQIEQLKKSL